MRKILIIPAFALLAATTAGVVASPDDMKHPNVPRDQWLSVAQIAEKFAAQGYDVRKVEADDGLYEVYAIDKNGMRLEVYVHPATGEIVRGYDDH